MNQRVQFLASRNLIWVNAGQCMKKY
jgi:hypothetical protein